MAPEVITEKNIIIQPIWLIKNAIGRFFAYIFTLIFLVYYFADLYAKAVNFTFFYAIAALFTIFTIMPLITSFIQDIIFIKTFKYSTGPQTVDIKQGLITKIQRTIPYGVIQHVTVTQTILDKIFRLSNVEIQNATQGSSGAPTPLMGYKKNITSIVGSNGNSIIVPGLFPEDAEILKKKILDKIVENPITENGL